MILKTMWALSNLYIQTGDVQTGRHPGEKQPGQPATLPFMDTPFSEGHDFFLYACISFYIKTFHTEGMEMGKGDKKKCLSERMK